MLGNMNVLYNKVAAFYHAAMNGWGWRLFPVVSVSLLFISGAVGFSDTVRSETLMQALSSAYVNNPTLSAERARQRATDEAMPIARSNFRPSLSATGDVTSTRTNTDPAAASDGTVDPWGYTISLNQPIFRGFRSLNEVRSAEAAIYAGREALRTVEQATLLSAVTVFVDVGRDLATVRLRQSNVRVLAEQLKATRDRFSVGEVTKTDVAQAEARLSGAQSELSVAQANLKTSRAEFERIIGHVPRSLQMPSTRFSFIPRSLDEALAVGDSENPDIVNAIYLELQARHEVDRIRGELLPTVSLEASYSERFDTSDTVNNTEVGTITGRLTFPFYQGGAVHARVRQAKQTFRQRTEEVRDARVTVRSDVISAWGIFESAQSALAAGRVQVRANRTALEGVREEEKVGQRTVLDVLDAEQELVDSQVDVVAFERELVVAAYSLLTAMGRLTAADMGLSVELYDAEQYYHEVRRRWFGKGPRLERVEHHHESRK